MATILDSRVRKLFAHPFHEQRSPEWFEQRKGKLTASDVAAAVHMNPYQSQRALFRKKICQGRKFTGNAATEWGTRNEPLAIERYVAETGRVVFEFGLITHSSPEHSYLAGSPDGVTACGRLLEVKCPLSREIKHEIPDHYYPQVQMLMEILDLDVCDFVQYRPASAFMDAEFDILEVPRDRAWFTQHVPILAEFWQSVVEAVSVNPRPESPPARKRRKLSPDLPPECLIFINHDTPCPTPRPSVEEGEHAPKSLVTV